MAFFIFYSQQVVISAKNVSDYLRKDFDLVMGRDRFGVSHYLANQGSAPCVALGCPYLSCWLVSLIVHPYGRVLE